MQQWLYLNFTRNTFYILFPTKGNVSYRQVISIRLNVCLKQWFPTFSEASSLCSFRNFLFLPYYTIFFSFLPYYMSLQKYVIYQYIVSHLTFTCHGVVYCSGSWTSINCYWNNGLY